MHAGKQPLTWQHEAEPDVDSAKAAGNNEEKTKRLPRLALHQA